MFTLNFRLFIYLVDKKQIFDFLVKDLPTIKSHKEVLLMYDTIIPTLNKNIMKTELTEMYPRRALLIYDKDKRRTHPVSMLHFNIICKF